MIKEAYGFDRVSNPSYCKVTFTADSLQLKILKEFLTPDTGNKKRPIGNGSTNSKSTIVLMLKLVDLFKDKFSEDYDIENIISFMINHVDDGILNGLPYINSVDKDMEIIEHVLAYVTEIMDAYNDDTGYRVCNNSRNFEKFFVDDKMTVKNMELLKLFTHNYLHETLSYKITKGETETLERMLDDYETFRDTVFFKLENVDFYIENYITNPMTYITLKTMREFKFKNELGYRKCVDNIESITLYATENLLELAIQLSYQLNIQSEIEYLNADLELKRYSFLEGELISSGYKSEKDKIISLIERGNLSHLDRIDAYIDFIEIFNSNINDLRIKDTFYIPDKIFSEHEDEFRAKTVYNVTNVKDIINNTYDGRYRRLKYDIICMLTEKAIKSDYKNSLTSFIVLLILLGREHSYTIGVEDLNVSILKSVKGKKLFKKPTDKTKKLFKNKDSVKES